MPDFDVTIVYEGNIETQEWLYYEQDGMVVTLGNWLNGRLSCEQIEQLWCELIIPENNEDYQYRNPLRKVKGKGRAYQCQDTVQMSVMRKQRDL